MKTYRYNEQTLRFEEVKYTFYKVGGFIILALMFMGFGSVVKINSIVEKIPVIINHNQEKCTPENVKAYIEELNLKYPDVVYQQVMLESNWLRSSLTKTHNNIICMANATLRPTLGHNVGTRFASYNNWKECLVDYAIWQAAYSKGITTKEDYYSLLDNIYCPSELEENKGPLYSTRLKSIK
jgi:hypothetical protein